MVQQANPYEVSSNNLLSQVTDAKQAEIAILQKASLLFSVVLTSTGAYMMRLIFDLQGYRDAFQNGLYRELAQPFLVELVTFVIPSLLSMLSFVYATREKQRIAKVLLLSAFVIFMTTIAWLSWQGISQRCSP